jgi:hypothetical protein
MIPSAVALKFIKLILVFSPPLCKVTRVFWRSGASQGGNTLNELSRRIAFELLNIMNKTIEQTVAVDQATVSRLAYQLWENAGRPAARDTEFWLVAEAQVRASANRASVPASRSEVSAAVSGNHQPLKSTRASRGGIKKTWPKPYPSLPRF